VKGCARGAGRGGEAAWEEPGGLTAASSRATDKQTKKKVQKEGSDSGGGAETKIEKAARHLPAPASNN
jgi:hypothetical protein